MTVYPGPQGIWTRTRTRTRNRDRRRHARGRVVYREALAGTAITELAARVSVTPAPPRQDRTTSAPAQRREVVILPLPGAVLELGGAGRELVLPAAQLDAADLA
jgi:hypothetical protein